VVAHAALTVSTISDADTIVVGAGLVGAACALRLAQAGREVLLVDPNAPGLGASFGNAGHIATEQLVPLANPEVIRASWRYLLAADSPLRLRAAYLLPILPWLARFVWAARPAGLARGVAALMALQRSASVDLQELLAQADLAHLLHMDGYLRIWESSAGADTARHQAAQMSVHGIRTDALSAAAVRSEAPGLNAEVGGAICYPDTGHVSDPHALCVGLVQALQRQQGRLMTGSVVELFQDRRGPVRLRLADGRVLHARQVLVSAGAWSRPMVRSLGYRVPLDTERGYHITVPWPGAGERAPSTMQLRRPVASTERSVIMTPMSVGLRMTGTLEFGGLALPPDPARYALLHRQLQALLPGTDTGAASQWMGFRPSLPDHLPVMGAAPRHRGVFFAFGHQHLGLTLCGVTARLMSDLMLERPSSLDLAPYHVERFKAW
jgi:glycine/D-amino acid oxidase-like deaminating enzyme